MIRGFLKYICLVCTITFCCEVSSVWAQRAEDVYRPVSSLPFELHDNRIYLNVRVQGHTGRFILDTGGYFGLDKNFAESIGLRLYGRRQIGGAGPDRVTAWYTRVDSVEVDALTLTDIGGPVINFTPMKSALNLLYLDGIIGYELFSKYVVDIDFRNKMVRFHRPEKFSPDTSWIRIPFTLYQRRIPLIEGELDSRLGRFIIDTGDRSELTLFKGFLSSHEIRYRYPLSDTLITGYGIGGAIRARTSTAGRLHLGEAAYDSVGFRIPVLTSGAFVDNPNAGSIGNGLLKRNNRVVFDYTQNLLYIEE